MHDTENRYSGIILILQLAIIADTLFLSKLLFWSDFVVCMKWLQINLPTFLQEWQNLITGLLAVIAAIGTIWFTRWQHNDVVRRKARSLRSQMAYTLSELIDYHKQCYRYIRIGDLQNDPQPSAPIEQLHVLQKYIGYTDPKTSKELFELVNDYQVFNSRLRGFREDSRVNGKDRIQRAGTVFCDVVKLTAYVQNMFSHAREERERNNKLEVTIQDKGEALKIIADAKQGQYGSEYDTIWGIIENDHND